MAKVGGTTWSRRNDEYGLLSIVAEGAALTSLIRTRTCMDKHLALVFPKPTSSEPEKRDPECLPIGRKSTGTSAPFPRTAMSTSPFEMVSISVRLPCLDHELWRRCGRALVRPRTVRNETIGCARDMRVYVDVATTNAASNAHETYERVPVKQKERSKGMEELRSFLKAAKTSLNKEEQMVTIVLGNESADLDSVVSAVMLAYLKKRVGSHEVYVPLVNIRRADLALRADVTWLLEVTGVEVSDLLFVDEVDMHELHRKKRVAIYLVDQNRLPRMLEKLEEVVVGVLDHHVDEGKLMNIEERHIAPVGSCASLVAEMIAAQDPQILADHSVCKLMLSAILADTVCLNRDTGRTTDLDEQMAALLLRGAGSLGAKGLFENLRELKCSQESFGTYDTLRRDFKQWRFGNVEVGMSSNNLPVQRIVGRENFHRDLDCFMKDKKLDYLFILPSFVDEAQVYRRQLVIIPSAQCVPHIARLSQHLTAEAVGLHLQEELQAGMPTGSLVFQQRNVKASRKVLQPILQEFFARYSDQ